MNPAVILFVIIVVLLLKKGGMAGPAVAVWKAAMWLITLHLRFIFWISRQFLSFIAMLVRS